MEAVPSPEQVEQTRLELITNTLEAMREMPKRDEEILAREIARDREVERSWDNACAFEVMVAVSDPWGETFVRGYCIGDKNHHGGHVPSTRTSMTREEILADLLPDWAQKPF